MFLYRKDIFLKSIFTQLCHDAFPSWTDILTLLLSVSVRQTFLYGLSLLVKAFPYRK